MALKREQVDLIIIGAGAAGLFAAVYAARSGLRVLVLEKNSRSGKKLALCGGGNCNIGPREHDIETLLPRYGVFGAKKSSNGGYRSPFRRGKSLWYQVPPASVREVFTDWGIRVREQDGQLFPADYDAPGFRDKLEAMALEAGARIVLNRHVTSLGSRNSEEGQLWELCCGDEEVFVAPHCFLACGGASYPTIGGTNQGNQLLSVLGVPVREGQPAMGGLHLRPVIAVPGGFRGPARDSGLRKSLPLADLSGLVMPVRVQVKTGRLDQILAEPQVEQILFTHRGLSGPAVLDICGLVHEASVGCDPGEVPVIVLDFCPSRAWKSYDDALRDILAMARENPRKHLASLVSELVPRALALALIDIACLEADAVLGNVTRAAFTDVALLLSTTVLSPRLPTPWTEVMSWTGGCDPRAVDFTTMELKDAPGLYVLGDMVALDRPCGGYSLWFAWTGALAAVRHVNEKTCRGRR